MLGIEKQDQAHQTIILILLEMLLASFTIIQPIKLTAAIPSLIQPNYIKPAPPGVSFHKFKYPHHALSLS